MKFGPKLFLILAGLILVLVVLTSWAAGQVLQGTYVDISTEAIHGAAEVVQATTSDRDDRLHLLLRPIVNDARIKGRLMARNGLEQEDAAALKEAGDDYFGSWMDEYWVADRDGEQAQDLMLLIGRDGTVAYGLSGERKHTELGDDVLGHLQISELIGAISRGEKSARMWWSGNRLRTRPPLVPGLEEGLYLAEAQRVMFPTPGTGADELAGMVIVATHRLDLNRVLATRADAIFVDHGVVAYSTFGLHDAGTQRTQELEAAAGAWVSANAHGDGGVTAVELAGAGYYAQSFEPSSYGMTPGPVTAGLFYSRAPELMTTRGAQERLALIGGVLALLAVGAAVALSRSLSRPIAEISAAAGKVAGGDLKVLVRADRKDELGDLARRFNEMIQGLREREMARSALGAYLSPEMAADLMKADGKVSLQGVRRELTILFCDVAGFTTISEQLQPEALVSLLNRYLDRMVKVLISQGAYVDKFEGDAIMAFWNAPRDVPDHALRACVSLLEMRAAAIALSAEWKATGMPAFTVRYGLHTGAAIVGNIGATDKINYTAIGDNVNLASRLEGANKQYGTELLISESTWEGAREQIEVRQLDVVKVKGKERPVRIFELLALKGQLSAEQTKVRDTFEAGLKLYRERRFAEANASFESAPADAPSRTFALRCKKFVETPPGPDWDGTYEMQTK